MKLIKLTQGLFTKVDDEDYDWLNQWKWYAQKDLNGLTTYVRRTETLPNGKRITIRMHRLILGLTNPKILGDHENGNGLDNQRHNIRAATPSQNCKNTTANGISKYLGVSIRRIKDGGNVYTYWRARIKVNNKTIYLGQSKDEKKAAALYNIAAKKYHKEFANLNIIL